MPTATDLVTDLPADFEVFGQAVATSMADLLGGTTGQILSKTSDTDMDFTWTTPNPGDITGVTAGVGITGGGTSGDVTVTNSMATAMTTSGDLIQATGSGTFARLATGTSGQYLTTNGTTNSWATISAGGMTLLSTTTMSGASVTISSISQSYKNLQVFVYGMNNGNNSTFACTPNGTSSITAQSASILGSVNGAGVDGAANNNLRLSIYSNIQASTPANAFQFTIYDYTSTTGRKAFSGQNLYTDTGQDWVENHGGVIKTTSAITSLVFSSSSGTYSAGTILVYGVS